MKKILAIAIAATMAAPAMADTTLYGLLHASLDSVDGADRGGSGTAMKSTSVSSNSSRIGVKGSADLTAGLKAIYQVEWGTDLGGSPGSTPGLSERNRVVGLAGGFGAILIGKHDTPFKTVGRKLDLGWSTQLGSNYNMVARGKGAAWDVRADQVIAYQTPKMGGFQALAAYVTEHNGNDGDAFSINGIYNAGPLGLLAAYETHSKDLIGAANDESAVRLGATYKFGGAKVVGMYQMISDEAGVNGQDRDVYGIGASYKVSSAGTIKGQYYTADDDAANMDADMFMIGYDHNLGKKTTVYAQYANLDTDEANSAVYQLGTYGRSDGARTDAGGNADGFSIGIQHKF